MMAEGATGELVLVPQEFYFTQHIIWLTDFFLYISSSPVHQHRLLLFFRLGAGGWVGGGGGISGPRGASEAVRSM